MKCCAMLEDVDLNVQKKTPLSWTQGVSSELDTQLLCPVMEL